MFILNVFKNQLLVNAVLGWFVAQFIKMVLYSIEQGGLRLRRLRGDGGMPSCHASMVTAFAVTAAIMYGLDSPWFALSAVLAAIVVHDAMGVRAEAGKHAQLLNSFLQKPDTENTEEVEQPKKMNEFLGHTPIQVLAGALVGCGVAFFFSFVVWK